MREYELVVVDGVLAPEEVLKAAFAVSIVLGSGLARESLTTALFWVVVVVAAPVPLVQAILYMSEKSIISLCRRLSIYITGMTTSVFVVDEVDEVDEEPVDAAADVVATVESQYGFRERFFIGPMLVMNLNSLDVLAVSVEFEVLT